MEAKHTIIPGITISAVTLLITWGLATFVSWLLGEWFSSGVADGAYLFVWIGGVITVIGGWTKIFRRAQAIHNMGGDTDELLALKEGIADQLNHMPSDWRKTYKEDLLAFAIRVMMQDGKVDAQEIEMLNMIFGFNMSKSNINLLIKDVTQTRAWDWSEGGTPASIFLFVIASKESGVTMDDFMPFIRTFETIGHYIAASDGDVDSKEAAYVESYIEGMTSTLSEILK